MAKRIRVWPVSEVLDSGLAAPPEVEAPSYLERMDEQRREWKAQDRRRFYNPEHEMPENKDPDALDWNVYAWLNTSSDPRSVTHWHAMGVRRKKVGRRKPMTMNRLFAGIRQQFGIAKDVPVLLVSHRDDKGHHPAPKHHDTLRSWTPPVEALATRPSVKPHKTKVRTDHSPKLELVRKEDSAGRATFTFKTVYAAWGRIKGKPWVYLGPAQATTKRSAEAEMRHRFPLYTNEETLAVLAVKTFSYSLRVRLMQGRVVPGATKMNPPGVK